jgi:hypothetical protein
MGPVPWCSFLFNTFTWILRKVHRSWLLHGKVIRGRQIHNRFRHGHLRVIRGRSKYIRASGGWWGHIMASRGRLGRYIHVRIHQVPWWVNRGWQVIRGVTRSR